jgi:hypothetical protein
VKFRADWNRGWGQTEFHKFTPRARRKRKALDGS